MVFAPDGELMHTYRKIHRFGFDSGEAVVMGAGQEIVTAPTEFGTLGLATCYDLRFPELFRALEEQAFVLACNTAGTHAGVEQAGHSVVVDPWGRVLAEAGPEEEVLTVEFDPAEVGRAREDFPVLRDRLLGIPAPVQR